MASWRPREPARVRSKVQPSLPRLRQRGDPRPRTPSTGCAMGGGEAGAPGSSVSSSRRRAAVKPDADPDLRAVDLRRRTDPTVANRPTSWPSGPGFGVGARQPKPPRRLCGADLQQVPLPRPVDAGQGGLATSPSSPAPQVWNQRWRRSLVGGRQGDVHAVRGPGASASGLGVARRTEAESRDRRRWRARRRRQNRVGEPFGERGAMLLPPPLSWVAAWRTAHRS